MASQRIFIATLAGNATTAAAAFFEKQRATTDAAAIDESCSVVRAHAASLPIVYFCEWPDWLSNATK